jgi:hypothetical protein
MVPVLYERNSYVTVSAHFRIEDPNFVSGSALIRGFGPDGIDIPSTLATAVGDGLSIQNVQSTSRLANTIDYYDRFCIRWEVSVNGGSTWDQAGISRVRFYVTLGAPEMTPYESPLALGCEAGKGAETPEDAVKRIWTPFADRKVKDKDGKLLLHYYLDWSTTYTRWQDLLKYKDGQCNAWAAYWYVTLKEQGTIQFPDQPVFRPNININYFTARNPNMHIVDDAIGFLVNKWTFGLKTSGVADWPYVNYLDSNNKLGWKNGDGTGRPEGGHYFFRSAQVTKVKKVLPGQGDTDPLADFYSHAMILVYGVLYDPSYGLAYDGVDGVDPFVKFVKTAIAGYFYSVDYSNPSNPGAIERKWLIRTGDSITEALYNQVWRRNQQAVEGSKLLP